MARRLLPFVVAFLAAARAGAAFIPVLPENPAALDLVDADAVPLGLVLESSAVVKNKPAPPPPSKPKEIPSIGKKEFDAKVRNAKDLTVVYFYATWCDACRKVSPLIDYLADQNPKVPFFKVDVDKEPELAKEFGASSIPHIVAFKDGKHQVMVIVLEVDEKGRVVGVRLVPKP